MPRVAIALLCAALVACGGGGSGGRPAPSGSPSPAGLSKPAYVAAVNDVCKKVGTRAEAIDEPTTAQQFADTLAELAGILEDGRRELLALEPPAADREEVQGRFLSGLDEQGKVLRDGLAKVRAAAEAGDKRGAEEEFVKTFEAFGKIADRDAKFAGGYGLTECV